MNIIFLDVDGVCNSFATHLFTDDAVDSTVLEMISSLCEEYDCKIVLSSAWRYSMDETTLKCRPGSCADKISKLLEKHKCPLIGRTPQLGTGRAEEIKAYIKDHLTTNDKFLIIDDENICRYRGNTYEDLEPHFLRTNAMLGFTYEDYKKACLFFCNDKNWKAYRVIFDTMEELDNVEEK